MLRNGEMLCKAVAIAVWVESNWKNIVTGNNCWVIKT